MDHLSKAERAYFKAAKAMAESSQHRFQVGAVLVHRHRIVGRSCNSTTKTDIIQAQLDSKRYGCYCEGKLHAESALLIPFIKRRVDLSGASIFVYRTKKDKTSAMARPCVTCMELIKACGIKKVYYSTDFGYAVEIIST